MSKVKDGLYPVYVIDGVVYPVALTEEQHEMFTVMAGMALSPITVIKDRPLGEAINLCKGEQHNEGN